METRTIGWADVVQQLFDIENTLPDRTNPSTLSTDGNLVCLYNGDDGEHCIVGQALAQLGLDTSKLIEGSAIGSAVYLYESDGVTFEPAAIDLLQQAQRAADGFETLGFTRVSKPRTWGQVIDILRFTGVL